MTFAASPSASAQGPASQVRRAPLWLVGALVALLALLIGLPDGVAEPLQTALAWTIVAMVAVLAVVAIAKGLDLLLDCETS